MRAYLDAYPNGRYRASARGLLRRVYWLAGDRKRLGDEYTGLMRRLGEPDVDGNGEDLIREIHLKYLNRRAAPPHDPILLAVEDLRRMREVHDEEREQKEGKETFKKPDFPSADLDAQASEFAGRDASSASCARRAPTTSTATPRRR